ncbi:MAG: 6,7-dimethyl-8-ribityllumazine synthase [Flavobacteriaceae bacterium]|nr:6,7-dimethyl-8-ribityllumazine synthase [Flavobacteriaceae bacterium]
MSQNSPYTDPKQALQFSEAGNYRIGIVTAKWNDDITAQLEKGAVEMLNKLGVKPENILLKKVPGSFELPLGAQKLLEAKKVDALLCFGCIIQGDTRHFDYVCQATTDGIMQVGLKYNTPVIFGVLTVNDHQQALDRVGGSHGHKGEEAAITALEMLQGA